MEMLYNTGSVVQKKNVEETRTVVFTISDSSKDRHGSIVNMDNWDLKNFNSNGIVGYQHDVYGGGMCLAPNPDSVIGKGRAWIENDGGQKVLMGSVEFEPAEINPLAEKVFRKVLNGTLKATSVGFLPIKNEKGEKGRQGYVNDDGEVVDEDTFYFYGQELLEFSIVNIPANPNALKRELRNQTANALQFLKRELGEDLTYGDIEQMKVMDVIRLLEVPKEERQKERSRLRDAALELTNEYGTQKGESSPRPPSKGEDSEELQHEEETASTEGAGLELLQLEQELTEVEL